MINAPVSDVNLGSARVEVAGRDTRLFLHTSPEYAMKRLLAAGSGDIFQICHVFRGAERGRQHNPEFTMLEWYRLGFSLEDLMDEVADAGARLLGTETCPWNAQLSRGACGGTRASIRWRRRTTSAAARGAGAGTRCASGASDRDRDELLDLIVGAQVGPALGADCADLRASLSGVAGRAGAARRAMIRALALRFELYHHGVELANGYHELDQRAPNSACASRPTSRRVASAACAVNRWIQHLLAALDAGLPDCAGVALGFDRVLMLAMGAASIDEVLAFPVERA